MTTRRRIDFNKYEKPKEEMVGGGAITGDLTSVMSLHLNDVMEKVKQGQNVIWVSDGLWSMHQLLMSMLDVTGPAIVHISSYAMGETPVRYIVQLKEAGLITELYCVLDNRVDTRSAGSLQVIMSISDEYSLIDTHAKVTVVQNDHWNLTVVGSANYTENKRYEAGIIMTTTAAADQQVKWIKKALKDGVK
jgi:hypothetical protein